MNIDKIRANSHELRSETVWWFTPNIPWDDRICHRYDTKRVKDEKHFLLDFRTLIHICSHFPDIYHISSLLHLLSQPIYSDLGALFSLLFEHINKVLKKYN